MSFRRRTFPEVFDNMVSAIAGGVSSESHPFPPKTSSQPPYEHILEAPPVTEVLSVYGAKNGKPHLFRKDVDYALKNKQKLVWKEGAHLPDASTLIQVNYFNNSSGAVLTDFHTGSVLRTITESVAMEIAQLYAQLEVVYQSGFIDAASGRALENVVALLGIERVSGGKPAGEVSFTRSPGSRGIINIPAGTRIITADGNVEYETTASVTMAEAQRTIRVAARDLERNDELPADSLTVLPVPIVGISGVTNSKPTAIATNDETDGELRTRAKNFLHGSERATLGAIKAAIARQGITAEVEETFDSGGGAATFVSTGVKQAISVDIDEGPGRIKITPHAETLPPELEQRLLTAIRDTRPAGIKVTLEGAKKPVILNLEMRITTSDGLLEQDLRDVQQSVQDKITDYFKRLSIGEEGSVNRIVGLVLSVPEIEDVWLIEANWTVNGTTESVLDRDNGLLKISGHPTRLGSLQIADPNLPTVLNAKVTYSGATVPASSAVQSALTAALSTLNGTNAADNPSAVTISFDALWNAVMSTLNQAVDFDAGEYAAEFLLIQANNAAYILSDTTDPPYTLTPFERVSLSDLQILPEEA